MLSCPVLFRSLRNLTKFSALVAPCDVSTDRKPFIHWPICIETPNLIGCCNIPALCGRFTAPNNFFFHSLVRHCDTSATRISPSRIHPYLTILTRHSWVVNFYAVRPLLLARVAASLVKLSVWQCCGGALTAVHGCGFQ